MQAQPTVKVASSNSARNPQTHLATTFVLSIGTVANQVGTGLAFLLIARSLAPSQFGVVVTLAGLASLTSDILDFGVSTRVARDAASGKIPHMVGFSILKFRLLFAGLTIYLALAISVLSPSIPLIVLLFITYSAMQVTTMQLCSILRARDRFLIISIASVIERSSALAFVVVSLRLHHDYTAYPFGLVVGSVLSIVFLTVAVGPQSIIAARVTGLKIAFRDSRSFAASGLLTDIQLLDTVIVTIVSGPASSAYFAVGARVTGPVGIPASSLSSVLLSRVASRAADRSSVIASIRRLTAIVAVLMGILAILAPYLIPLVFGESYKSAVHAVQIYSFAMVLATYNQPTFASLQAVGQQRRLALLVSVVSIISLIVVGLGAASFGSVGASVGFLLMQLLSLAFLRHWFRKAFPRVE